MFDNLQSMMNNFPEALYFLQVEIMAYLDHYNSIELETWFPSNNLGYQTMHLQYIWTMQVPTWSTQH